MSAHPQKAPSGALARLVPGGPPHPHRTIAIGLLVVIGIITVKVGFGGELVNNTTIPGSEAQKASDLLAEKFPQLAGDSARVVFASDTPLENANRTPAFASTPGVS